MTAQQLSPTAKKSRPWLIPTIVGVIALLIGIGIGAAGGSADESKPKPPAVKSASGLTAAQLDAQEKQLQAAREELSARTDEIDVRERAVAQAEQKAKANTIDGDGVYAVGDDIKAGTWKNADRGPNCYWSINSDPNGENIVSNGNGGGPQTLTVKKGQYLELMNDCGTWNKIG